VIDDWASDAGFSDTARLRLGFFQKPGVLVVPHVPCSQAFSSVFDGGRCHYSRRAKMLVRRRYLHLLPGGSA